MNSIRISTLLRFLGLALVAACFNAGFASAQAFQGKFTLPFTARWGQAVLPAGEYWLKLDDVRGTNMLQVYRENRGVALILAQAQNKADSGPAQLTIVRGTVRTLSLPQMGLTLEYAPQHPKHLTAPEERVIAQIVPVAASN